MTLVGAVNIPIIKFSVDWWNTLHQPASVFRAGGPAMTGSMLYPLLVMAVGATLLFLTLHLMSIRNEILERRLERLTRRSVDNRASAGATLLGPVGMSDSHAAFIIAAYFITFVVMGATIGRIVLRHRALRRGARTVQRQRDGPVMSAGEGASPPRRGAGSLSCRSLRFSRWRRSFSCGSARATPRKYRPP